MIKMIKGKQDEEDSRKISGTVDLTVEYINEELKLIYTQIMKEQEKKERSGHYNKQKEQSKDKNISIEV